MNARCFEQGDQIRARFAEPNDLAPGARFTTHILDVCNDHIVSIEGYTLIEE